MAKSKIADTVREMLSGYLPELGLALYDCAFQKEGQDYYLRVYIDRTDGNYVGTDDCEKVSRALSDELDKSDPIRDAYILEVSSPGLGRKLKKDRHFEKSIGEKVEVKLFEAADGSKEYTGILKSYDAESITVSDAEVPAAPKNSKGRKPSKKAVAEAESKASETKEMTFKRKEISTVRLVVEF